MLSKLKREPDGRKEKKDQGEGKNENFRGSWIEQRPREKGGSSWRKRKEKEERKRRRNGRKMRNMRKKKKEMKQV